MYVGGTEAEMNINSDHCDRILFGVCQILNCNLWPKPTSNKEAYTVQLNAFKNVFDCYSDIEGFSAISFLTEGFLAITSYAYHCFDILTIKLMEVWSKMLDLHQDNTSWKAAPLVVELCFCAPILNATLKRLFSHMNLVKTIV